MRVRAGDRDDLRRIERRSEPLYKRRNWVFYSRLKRNGSFEVPHNLENYTLARPSRHKLSREKDRFLLCEHLWVFGTGLHGHGRVPKRIR